TGLMEELPAPPPQPAANTTPRAHSVQISRRLNIRLSSDSLHNPEDPLKLHERPLRTGRCDLPPRAKSRCALVFSKRGRSEISAGKPAQILFSFAEDRGMGASRYHMNAAMR